MGEAEQSRAVAIGAGVRAASATEQFRVEQRVGQRGAIDGDEGAVAPATLAMDAARDAFLARSGFAADEHGQLAARGTVGPVERAAPDCGATRRVGEVALGRVDARLAAALSGGEQSGERGCDAAEPFRARLDGAAAPIEDEQSR